MYLKQLLGYSPAFAYLRYFTLERLRWKDRKMCFMSRILPRRRKDVVRTKRRVRFTYRNL